MCIPLKERTQIWKVILQKWRHKNGSTVFMLTSAKTKRELFCEQKKKGDLTTAEHKVLNEGRESRNNHRYAVVAQVLATQWNPCEKPFFFFLNRRERLKTQNNSRQKTSKFHASSLNPTLHSGGHAPPPSEPRLDRMPSKEAAKALAAAQDNIVHHLSRRMSLISFLARARASNPMKRRVSSDHLPATSPAITTSLARALGWTNSGYVLSLRRLARTRAAPSESAAPGVGVPSQWSGDTNVVSTANCAPPKRGKPSTTISSRRPSRGSGAAMSMSRTMTLVATLPPASLHMRAPTLSRTKPRLPSSPVLEQAAR